MNTNLMQYSTEQLTQMLQAQQITPVDYQQEMQRRMAAMAQPQQAQQQVPQGQPAQAAPAQPMRPQMVPGQQMQQPSWADQAAVWMHMHPKTTVAGAMVLGGVAVTGVRYGYNKFLGGDSNYSEEEASAVVDSFSEILGR